MSKRVLIVGGVAGGMSAAARARRLSESAEIIVFERGPDVSYANCGLPYFLGGEIADRKKLLVQTPERLKAVFNIEVRTRSEVTAIHRGRREIDVRDLVSGHATTERYDALILSTGAAPIVPRVPGAARAGHFALRTLEDMDRIDAWVRDRGAKTAVVVGGGFIGLEVAEQFHARGLRVAVVERNPQVLKPFDPEMAAHLHLELRGRGVALHLNNGLKEFDDPRADESASASVVVLADGTRLPADVVVTGLGVRPESTLAVAAGLDLGRTGGIKVDEHLRTSDPNIYAVGDAIEVTHAVTGAPALIPLGGPANRQGRTAADNIFGTASACPGALGTAIVRVFGLTAAVTGANEAQLRAAGIAFEAVHLHPNSHAGYYPGARALALKILFAPDSGKLLGAQAVGPDGVDKRVDVLATALRAGLTVDDVADLELCYAPPFGSAKDPVNLAGMVAQNVRAGRVRTIQWDEVAALDRSHVLVLDVRDAPERAGGAIPDSVHIPLGELRARLSELPRDREIVAHCASGQRSYTACRVLMQHGFRCRNLAGSFKTWKAARDGLTPQ
ncbi:FAD-dependent oxidoreductase [Gemmata sp. G18]|uniref:FAD-dependent oxidoreductase n=1 Tax=Gemmata palustris TaxID=2822762 RepID=A0ABS5C4I7_9BACT|nr:FAD-dependent oxidoreductase [Gemmata palustris]MBP3960909.1 FAD-dependent oxidoreductase [Gemmata palustris]